MVGRTLRRTKTLRKRPADLKAAEALAAKVSPKSNLPAPNGYYMPAKSRLHYWHGKRMTLTEPGNIWMPAGGLPWLGTRLPLHVVYKEPTNPQGAYPCGNERGLQPGRKADRQRQRGCDAEGVGREEQPGNAHAQGAYRGSSSEDFRGMTRMAFSTDGKRIVSRSSTGRDSMGRDIWRTTGRTVKPGDKVTRFARRKPAGRRSARRGSGTALSLLQAKEFTEAEPLLRDCLAIREKAQPDEWTTFNTKSMLGGALLCQDKYAEAEPLLLAGYEGMKQRETNIPLEGKIRLTEALERLTRLYEALEKKDKASKWRKELQARKEMPERRKLDNRRVDFSADRHAAEAHPRPKSVRIVYLVSADRMVREDFKKGIETAAKDLQGWYGKQLGGPTFRLNDPVVEVAKSDKDAKWFYSHPNGDNKDDWGFNNGLAEAQRLVGARQGDPEYVWVIYSDGPGNKGRGGGGVTVLPEDDLLGLVGQHPEQKDVKRWIAGLGHELGHAFGLDHPRDTEKYADAIMWTGDLRQVSGQDLSHGRGQGHPHEKPVLLPPQRRSGRQACPGRREVRLRRRFFHEVFKRREIGMGGVQDGRQCGIPVRGNQRDKEWIRLFDSSRDMALRLPVGGGRCSWSTDEGKTWNALYRVDKAK